MGVAGYLRKHWLALFSAFVLGLGFPLWRMYVYESPDLQVEITGVDKSTDLVRIDIAREELFEFLAGGLEFAMGRQQSDMSLDELGSLLERRERLQKARDEQLEKMRDHLEEIVGTTPLTSQVMAKWNGPLIPEIRPQKSVAQLTPEELAEVRTEFEERYKAEIADLEERLTKDKKNIESARTALERRREVADATQSRLLLDCAISNTGAGAISLKPQALLRVFLGGDNYFDIELQVDNYEEKGNLPPKSSKILRLKSALLGSMGETTRARIASYFTQNVPARVFLVDIRGRVHSSKIVPFARGFYDQTVYDQLRRSASAGEDG